jgi:two-component system, cell cycle response regulator CpdR
VALATILVVDDTAEVREITAAVLSEAGYGVISCAGSREALDVLSDGHSLDLLVTDIAMPEMDGFELARHARALRPALLVAYLTGRARAVPNGPGEVPGPILQKPYRAADLVRQVEDLMAPSEDTRLVRAVALEMTERSADAFERATESAEIARLQGDGLSAQAWHDIAEAIATLQARG